MLFTPISFRGLTFKNRIVVSPMCQYSSEDGFATDWHLVHLGPRAVGGASLVFTEAAAVTPEGRITPQDLGIWKEQQAGKLGQIAAFVRAQGAEIGIQLAHAGRKGSTARPWQGGGSVPPEQGGFRIVAPSPVRFREKDQVPQALDEAGIARIVRAFADAADRAHRAGFTAIELHAAHGYLLHEFLSPLSNRRTDRYGGATSNPAPAGRRGGPAGRSRTAPGCCSRRSARSVRAGPSGCRSSSASRLPTGCRAAGRPTTPSGSRAGSRTRRSISSIARAAASSPVRRFLSAPAIRCRSPRGSGAKRACRAPR